VRPIENEVFELSENFFCIDIGTVILNFDMRTHDNTEKRQS
jgi:hypothetical protein